MARLILFSVMVGTVAGGAYFLFNYETEVQRDDDGQFQSVTVTPRGENAEDGAVTETSARSTTRAGKGKFRIATFNLSGLDRRKLGNRQLNDILLDVIARFDLLALQNLRAENQAVLVQLVEQLAAKGKKYDFATGQTVGDDQTGPYSAFLFNPAAVGIDRSTVQLVDDPDDRLRHRPLVALFQAVGPDPSEAFTFRAINVHIDPIQAVAELNLLDDVYRAVRDSGSPGNAAREDDIILLGDFGIHQADLTQWSGLPEIIALITRTPTTLRATLPVDNILIDRRATAEFTGLADVFDLMQHYELSMRATLQVSEHMPVWAEFSSYEGGQSGHIATDPARTTR